MMHEGAIRVMDGLWRSCRDPSGQDPKDERRKAEGGKLKEYTGFSLTGRKLECQQGRHAGQTPWQRACDEGHGEDED